MIYDGAKITALRLQKDDGKGWSMAKLAREAKISQPSLWALEHQITKRPKMETMMRIAAALGVPLGQILTKPPHKGPDALLDAYSALTEPNKAALLAAASALLKSQK